MYRLLIHYLKEKIRSPFWRKSIILNILLGLLGLYLALNLFMLGFLADKILMSVFPNQEIIYTFNRLMFYYFTFDIILRFFLQKLPVISIQPYLNLPIKKKVLLHFPLIRSSVSFFNLVALLILLPFFVKVICMNQSLVYSIVWLITVLSLILTNNYLNFALKKYLSKRPLSVILGITLLGAILYFDISNRISLSPIVPALFNSLGQSILFAVIPIFVVFAAYSLVYILLKRNSYIETTTKESNPKAKSLLFLSNYGVIGNLIRTEIKLILRNKRPKSMLYLSAFFLLYGFIFYHDIYLNNQYMLIFVGIFLTSTLAMFYYQYVFSWESSFLDCYLVHRISAYDFVASKYSLFATMCIVSYLLTLPYAFIDHRIVFVNTAMLLYNIGVSSIILFYFATFSNSFIDLGRSQFMNYQGTGANHFLMMIPLMGIPLLAPLILGLFDMKMYSFHAIGLLGLLAIIFHKYLIVFVGNQLVRRKYKMSYGFRQ